MIIDIVKHALMISGFVFIMMLPILAHSRRTFLGVKAINVAVGFVVGLIGYFMQW